MAWKYLHKVGNYVSWLDHRLTPEVRGMFAAMMSRVPKGGIEARYSQIVHAVAEGLWDEIRANNPEDPLPTWPEVRKNPAGYTFDETLAWAEERLTSYPLHPKVQEFFDQFVLQYGHSSIMELVGSPTVIIEHISMWMAYLTFDNPLVKGQEMSTRAVWRTDWPMAAEAMFSTILNDGDVDDGCWGTDLRLIEIHDLGLKIAAAELEAWKVELKSECQTCFGDGWIQPERERVTCDVCNGTGKKYPWMNDPQAFRPAFDRARWALPGTIETGVSHSADLRTMARVIKVMEDIASSSGCDTALRVIEEIREAYRQALPGMADMGLREAVYGGSEAGAKVPGHLRVTGIERHHGVKPVVVHTMRDSGDLAQADVIQRARQKTYADPYFNQHSHVDIEFWCSLAAARDWHRHRTFYPWRIRVQRGDEHLEFTKRLDLAKARMEGKAVPTPRIQLHRDYQPMSEFGKANLDRYFRMCTDAHDEFMAEGNLWMAMLCLPLGATVQMKAGGGLRDALYMLELRAFAHGANFEYEAQAKDALDRLGALTETIDGIHPQEG